MCRSTVILGFFLLCSINEAALDPVRNGVSLMSSLSPIPLAFGGKEIVLTCTTVGSGILEWISEEYIGTDEIQILSLNNAPDTVNSSMNPNTTATRIHVAVTNQTEIVSELRIIASSQYPMGSVTCRNVDLGTTRTITFQVSDNLTLISSVSENENMAYDQQMVDFTCTTLGSGILEWISEQYIGTDEIQILSLSNAPDTVNSSMNPNTTATRIRVTVNSLGIIEIVSILQIKASSLYQMGSVTCRNVDFGSTRTIVLQISGQVSPTSSTSQVDFTSTDFSTTFEVIASQPGSNQGLIAGVVAGSFIVVVVVAVAVVIVFLVVTRLLAGTIISKRDSKIHSSDNQSDSGDEKREEEMACTEQPASPSDPYDTIIGTPMNTSLVEASFGKNKNSRISADSGHAEEESNNLGAHVQPQEETNKLEEEKQEYNKDDLDDLKIQEAVQATVASPESAAIVYKTRMLAPGFHITLRPNEEMGSDDAITPQQETSTPEKNGMLVPSFTTSPIICTQTSMLSNVQGQEEILPEACGSIITIREWNVTKTECASLPTKMDEVQCTTVGGMLYIQGATDPSDHEYTIYCYDPANDEWNTLPILPVKYCGLGNYDNLLVAVGGIKQNNDVSNEIYTFYNNQWDKTILPELKLARHSSCVLSFSSQLVVAGGKTKSDSSQYTCNVEIYDEDTNKWCNTIPMPKACDMSSIIIKNKAFVIGRVDSKSVLFVSIEDLESGKECIDDGKAADTVSFGSLPAWKVLKEIPMELPSAATLGGSLMAIGGRIDGNITDQIYTYGMKERKWKHMEGIDLPHPLLGCGICTFSPNEFYVIGGCRDNIESRDSGDGDFLKVNSVYKFCLSTE